MTHVNDKDYFTPYINDKEFLMTHVKDKGYFTPYTNNKEFLMTHVKDKGYFTPHGDDKEFVITKMLMIKVSHYQSQLAHATYHVVLASSIH